ncbi:hypothetical protein T492DRAFT_954299 [Pavlovales sp. CCMP2436]|nr:hypothetical protein T492DRAFT_954299 [Pavlovales sp. CCMP2436]
MGPPVSCWTVEPLFWRRGGRRARGGRQAAERPRAWRQRLRVPARRSARVLAGDTGAGLCTSTGHSTTSGSLGLWPCAQRSRPRTSRLMGAAALRATRTSDSFTSSSFRICSPPQTASPLPSAFSTRIGIERRHATPLQLRLLKRGGSCHIRCLRSLSLLWYPPLLLPSSPPSAAPTSPVQPPPLPATASASPRPPRSARHRRAERNIERNATQLAHCTPMGPCGIYSVRWDLVQITSAGRRREPRDIAVSVQLRGAY